MDKDKIIVSVVIDKQALVDRAFDISKNPSEFNEIKKVIDSKNQFTRDIDEIDDEGKKENNTNLFAGIALDTILCDNQELGITKRLKAPDRSSRRQHGFFFGRLAENGVCVAVSRWFRR